MEGESTYSRLLGDANNDAKRNHGRHTYISKINAFLWSPKAWDKWWFLKSDISLGLSPGDRVIAELPNEDGLEVRAVIKQLVYDDESKEGQAPNVLVQYDDPNSHAFCCKIKMEAVLSQDSVERVIPMSYARAFENMILILIAVNIATFILGTLKRYSNGTEADGVFDIIEDVSVAIFTVEYLLRVYACVECEEIYKEEGTIADRTLKKTREGGGDADQFQRIHKPYSGPWGRFWYVTTDFYAVLDLAAILPFYVDLALVSEDIAPTTWLRALRLLRLLKADREADMLSKFDDVLVAIRPALIATGYVGGVFWILASTAMYYCERNNPDVGGRLNSIPNSMYYTMQMLMGEFVLNNEFTVPGKVVATFIAIFGAIFFSIPVGLFGGAFLALAGGDEDEDEDEEGEEEANGVETKDSKERRGEGEEKPDSVVDQLAVRNEGRAWRMVEEAATAMDKIRAGCCFVLSAYGTSGWCYKMISILLVIVAQVTLVLASVPSIQSDEGFRTFDKATELLSLLLFSIEFLARIWCVIDSFDERTGRKEFEGWQGRMAFVFSFFGLVDLLSILPSFIAFGLSVESNPKSLLRVCRLIRILKLERFIPAFTLFDNVFAAQRHLLAGLAYTVLVLWLAFSCLMYLAEKDHKATAPDDDIVAHPYNNMFDSMWYTLLNITGEFPLGDYSVWGKVIGFFMVIFAIELYGAASGVFAEGFQSTVEKVGTRKDVW